MPYYDSNEPYQRIDGVGNGALAGALLAGGASGMGVWLANKHYNNMDARMDSRLETLEDKRSSIYEKARNKEAKIDEKVSNMRMNPIEAGRITAGHAAQNMAGAYYKPAYNMERNLTGSGDVLFNNAEEAMADRTRRNVAAERYTSAVGGSKAYQWGSSQIDSAHTSYVNRQGKKRQKLMNKVNNMRQSANEMQGQISHLKDAEYRATRKANHFYAKHLGGFKRNALAIGGATVIGALSGAFLDAAATPIEQPEG